MNNSSYPEETAALKRFHGLRVEAHYNRLWLECRIAKCRRNKACKGGPRGTFRHSGVPACLVFGEYREIYDPVSCDESLPESKKAD